MEHLSIIHGPLFSFRFRLSSSILLTVLFIYSLHWSVWFLVCALGREAASLIFSLSPLSRLCRSPFPDFGWLTLAFWAPSSRTNSPPSQGCSVQSSQNFSISSDSNFPQTKARGSHGEKGLGFISLHFALALPFLFTHSLCCVWLLWGWRRCDRGTEKEGKGTDNFLWPALLKLELMTFILQVGTSRPFLSLPVWNPISLLGDRGEALSAGHLWIHSGTQEQPYTSPAPGGVTTCIQSFWDESFRNILVPSELPI